MTRIPNTKCETVAVGRVQPYQVIRAKSYAPPWDDQADKPWDQREHITRSTDYVVLHVAISFDQRARRATRYYTLALAERAALEAGNEVVRDITVASSTRFLKVPNGTDPETGVCGTCDGDEGRHLSTCEYARRDR